MSNFCHKHLMVGISPAKSFRGIDECGKLVYLMVISVLTNIFLCMTMQMESDTCKVPKY